ncbi:MAG: Fic family protein [Candidatus Didemnitutus sp.]|nr:Fic family protein [Candidatus Didemnitutus sp.]
MPLLFGSSDSSEANQLARMIKRKEARKLASRIYTTDLTSPVEELIRADLLAIVRRFYPGAVISYRTAIEAKPSPAGIYHITHGRRDKIHPLPGVTLRIWKGAPAQAGDTQLGADLFMGSRSRALLENLAESRAGVGGERKTLERSAVETWLDRLCRIHGPDELRRLLAAAEELAPVLGLEDAAQRARTMIAALVDGVGVETLVSPVGRARARREPYDPDRVGLFTRLASRLATENFASVPERPEAERRLHAFWEAYFSNYIEGTVFTIQEAREIVFDHKLPPARPKDAHDILSTFHLATDGHNRREVPRDADDLLRLLEVRHARLMHDRLDVGPGRFKETANRVGTREFVAPELVRGTLRLAFELGRHLAQPVARGAFVMFIVAEVHPFNDGNGRLARLFLNAELTAGNCGRLIVPTSLRGDYLSCLEALTVGGNPEPFLVLISRLIGFSAGLPCGAWEQSVAALEKSGALKDAPAGSWGIASAML